MLVIGLFESAGDVEDYAALYVPNYGKQLAKLYTELNSKITQDTLVNDPLFVERSVVDMYLKNTEHLEKVFAEAVCYNN